MMRNEIRVFKKSPIRNLLPFSVKLMPEKSGALTIAAMNGVIRSFTSAVHDTAERGADDHADRQIDGISPEDEFFKSFEHEVRL